MPIEIEKKYRLTKSQRQELQRRLPEIGAIFEGEEFEENTLYSGDRLDVSTCVLRLRRVGDGAGALLTYKQRFPSASSIKEQQENETQVSDADATDAILQTLGYKPALVYEKRRSIWRLGDAEVDVDELPFGLFMEIEANPNEIVRVEKLLSMKGLQAEMETYPDLTLKHGKRHGDFVESRFPVAKKSSRKT